MGLVVSEKKIFLVFLIVSLWDLSVAMETTILIQSAPKPNAINPPTQLWFTLNLVKIGLLASEIFMSPQPKVGDILFLVRFPSASASASASA